MANGPPKAGTHALMALLDTMGLKRAPGTILGCHKQQLHISGINAVMLETARLMPHNTFILAHAGSEHAEALAGFRILTVFRDPRNCLVSYCRHRFRDGYIITIQDALKDFWGAPFVETYAGFLGWKGRSLTLRYEDMPQAVIGEGVGIYPSDEARWNTRTGAPSRWQDHWNGDIQDAWVKYGGPELLQAAGYAS